MWNEWTEEEEETKSWTEEIKEAWKIKIKKKYTKEGEKDMKTCGMKKEDQTRTMATTPFLVRCKQGKKGVIKEKREIVPELFFFVFGSSPCGTIWKLPVNRSRDVTPVALEWNVVKNFAHVSLVGRAEDGMYMTEKMAGSSSFFLPSSYLATFLVCVSWRKFSTLLLRFLLSFFFLYF